MPSDKALSAIQTFINQHQDQMIAIGEVGLPYYLRQKNNIVQLDPYIEILEAFVKQAQMLSKPIILHAIYEDAEIACDLLERYSVKQAHFHWFKGSEKIVARLIENGYFISITPDVLYEREIQTLVKRYPLEQLMVETDGPWSFEGPFKNQLTRPKMIHQVVQKIATMKDCDLMTVYAKLYSNSKTFYNL